MYILVDDIDIIVELSAVSISKWRGPIKVEDDLIKREYRLHWILSRTYQYLYVHILTTVINKFCLTNSGILLTWMVPVHCC